MRILQMHNASKLLVMSKYDTHSELIHDELSFSAQIGFGLQLCSCFFKVRKVENLQQHIQPQCIFGRFEQNLPECTQIVTETFIADE